MRIQGKQRAAVIQDEAIAGHGDAGAEGVIDAVDERHHVAPAIGGGKIYRAADRIPLASGVLACANRSAGTSRRRTIFEMSFATGIWAN